MTHRTTLIILLAALMGAAAFPQAIGSVTPTLPWEVFLFGFPLALIGCLLANQRWALMAAVMYGTVGLARISQPSCRGSRNRTSRKQS